MVFHTCDGTGSWVAPGAGISKPYDCNDQSLRIFVVFFSGLSIYNACELLLMTLVTFKSYKGSYFWSMVASGIGILIYSIGWLLKSFALSSGSLIWLAIFLLSFGWYPMVTGQAFVLWSRLHIIVKGTRGEQIIRYTFWMIVIDAIIFHTPTTVLTLGSNGSLDTGVFQSGYNIMEKIQMTGFFLQEVLLSSIYILETARILRTSFQAKPRKVLWQLIIVNVVIIIMDLILLSMEYASLYVLETLTKGLIYSIKLKLEFVILGKLLEYVVNTTTVIESTRHGSADSFWSAARMRSIG